MPSTVPVSRSSIISSALAGETSVRKTYGTSSCLRKRVKATSSSVCERRCSDHGRQDLRTLRLRSPCLRRVWGGTRCPAHAQGGGHEYNRGFIDRLHGGLLHAVPRDRVESPVDPLAL